MTSATNAIFQKSYAIIRVKGSPQKARVQLPIVLGTQAACDLIINSQAVSDCGLVVFANAGNLALYHPRSASLVDLDALEKLGVHCIGPVPGLASRKTLKSGICEALLHEQRLFNRWPRLFQLLSLGCLSQRRRLSAWLLVALVALTFILMPKGSDNKVDFADIPIELAFNVARSEPIGANKHHPGYEHGMTFVTDLSATDTKEDALFSFKAGGLNYGREIVLTFNGKELFGSEVDTHCLTEFCEFHIPVSQKLLRSSENHIRIQHAPADSAYFVQDILFRSTPPLSDVEREQTLRWLQVAQRAYDERDVVPDNLVIAKAQLTMAKRFLLTRKAAGDLLAKVEVLKTASDRAFENITKDLWTKVDVALKLENNDQAETLLRLLLRLYPDSGSRENQNITAKLEQLKEQKQ